MMDIFSFVTKNPKEEAEPSELLNELQFTQNLIQPPKNTQKIDGSGLLYVIDPKIHFYFLF